MTFAQEFSLLFSEIGIATSVCLILGIVFVIIEMFVPGFGFFGISGGILIFVGIGLRAANSGDGNPIFQFFMLLLITILILLLALGLAIYSTKKGWLSRTGIVDHNKIGKVHKVNSNKILNKTGITITNLRPFGSAKIENKVYEVATEGDFIKNKTNIIVDKIEDNKIYVKEIK